MSETVKIIFSGALVPGQTVADVAPRLAAAMKITQEQAQSLFSGQSVVLKRDLPRADWPRYAAGLRQLGILVDIEDENPSPPAEDLLFPSLLGGTNPPPPTSTTPEPVVPANLPPETMSCPKCGTQQPRRTLCRECGVDMPRYQAAQLEVARDPVAAIPNRIEPSSANPADGAEFTPAFRDISFEGRLGRINYMSYSLGAILIFGVIMGVFLGLHIIKNWVGVVFFSVLLVVFLTRLSALRLHDMDKSGWWQLLALPLSGLQSYAVLNSQSSLLIKLAGLPMLLFYIWILAWPGSHKENRFGLPNEAPTALSYVGAVFLLILLIGSGVGAEQKGLPQLNSNTATTQGNAHGFVVLYCASNNTYCSEARSWFAQHPRIQYDDCDIDDSKSCRDEFKQLGGKVVPLLVVGNKKHNGFDPDWLMDELRAEMQRRIQQAQQEQQGQDDD